MYDAAVHFLSQLHQLSTFPENVCKEFTNLYGVSFGYKILGDISRRDITLNCLIMDHKQVTKKIGSSAKNHLKVANRKVAIYSNTVLRTVQINESTALDNIQ